MNTVVPTKFLIDGIDRLGKSSLVKSIQDIVGYHLVIHYDKPKMLQVYYDFDHTNLERQKESLKTYQIETNKNMFELLKTDVPIIFDRTHLGEMVYAPLYRKYSGEYVYEIEKDFIETKRYTQNDNVRLILLTTSNFNIMTDDGLSFDPTKKEQEQAMFIEAFNRSGLTNKVIVDVHDGKGGYKPYHQVFREAVGNSIKI